jgi:hypothetical protein
MLYSQRHFLPGDPESVSILHPYLQIPPLPNLILTNESLMRDQGVPLSVKKNHNHHPQKPIPSTTETTPKLDLSISSLGAQSIHPSPSQLNSPHNLPTP